METKHQIRIYTKREFVKIISDFTYSILKYHKELKGISKGFQTNIMLAVTEVNGCQLCSYFHTKNAIDSGIGDSELQSILSGDHKFVKPEEAKALLFAQHYAFEKEHYSEVTFQVIRDYYGDDKANAILSNIRMISFGNAYGINATNLKSRCTKKGKIENSKLFTELFVVISPLFLFPITLIINMFRKKQ